MTKAHELATVANAIHALELAHNRIEELERENAELRKDAERYQWVRMADSFKVERILNAAETGADADTAIDEAMK